MCLRCRLVASAGTMRHNLSYSRCCSWRIDALRYFRQTRRPATSRRRRPPLTGVADLDVPRPRRAGWLLPLTMAAGTRRRMNGLGRADFLRNIPATNNTTTSSCNSSSYIQRQREAFCRPRQRSVMPPLQPATLILSGLNKLKNNINLR